MLTCLEIEKYILVFWYFAVVLITFFEPLRISTKNVSDGLSLCLLRRS